LVAKKKRSQPSRSQLTLNQWQKQSFLEKLTPTQLKIIQLIDEGLYQAAIARQLGYSRSYICKFVNKLKQQELVTVKWRNPLTQRAISYGVTKELQEALSRLEVPGAKEAYSLCSPHKIRYQRKILSINKPIVTNISRFAAAKFKHKKSWTIKGGERHLFEMKHDRVGKIGIIVHPLLGGLYSIEYYQAYRHELPAKDVADATMQLSMALEEATSRFQQELGWCGVDITYGKPSLVGSPHYSFPSRLARALTDAGQTKLQFAEGFDIDKSLEDKHKEKNVADLECSIEETAAIVDKGLRNAANIENIVPALVKGELKGLTEALLNINKTIENLNSNYTNVAAMCQSGLPLQNQYNQIQTIVANQGQQITLIQKTLLKVVENMGKLIEKSDVNKNAV